MSNEYYEHTTYPEESSFLSSLAARTELDLVQGGFGKLPTLSTTANKIWQTSSVGTSCVALASLSANSITFSSGSSVSLSGVYSLSITLTGNTSVTMPTTGTVLTTTSTISKATNISGGVAGQIPYQSAPDTTSFYTPSGTGVPAMTSGATFTNPTFSSYTEAVYNNGTGSSFTLSYANGGLQKLTTNGNTTITLPSPVSGKRIELAITYGGAHTITFSGGGTIKYDTATAPIATSSSGKIDIYLISCFDGTNTIVRDGGRNF